MNTVCEYNPKPDSQIWNANLLNMKLTDTAVDYASIIKEAQQSFSQLEYD